MQMKSQRTKYETGKIFVDTIFEGGVQAEI